MQVALIYQERNSYAYSLLEQMADYLQQKGTVILSPLNKRGFSSTNLQPEAFTGCDACIVLGGDGTFLAAARCFSAVDIPFFAVNLGRIGFLTQVEKEQVFPALDCLLQREYIVKERIMLQASLLRSSWEIASLCAFNDIVIRSSVPRMIKLELLADGGIVNSFNADGLILSTPSGSTGYSLSAGGPILYDELDVLLATPISARTFLNRSIVFPGSMKLQVLLKGEQPPAMLTADGQKSVPLLAGDSVEISISPQKAKVIYFDKEDFFQRIKDKLYF